ncbi:hypothetical protein bhYOR_001067 (plasmid) [Borrelia nietonii YOR]|nr:MULTISPECIES: Bdr family repetitive protein [Borrelia]UPA09762.1 hypothetical protein bhYOR_001067 [Borrelia nietonii YOR]
MQNVKVKDNPYITEKRIYSEFVKIGMHKAIALDLSKRYYHNELTYKDLENLERNFNLKIENFEKQFNVKFTYLEDKIDNVKAELNIKIDNAKAELNTKIDNVEKNLNLKFDYLNDKIDVSVKALNENIKETNNLVRWVFGFTFVIAITIIAGFIFK